MHDIDINSPVRMRELAKASRPKTGIERIAAERQRQQDVEGWTPEHDDEHNNCELLAAASTYAEYAYDLVRKGGVAMMWYRWPWALNW